MNESINFIHLLSTPLSFPLQHTLDTSIRRSPVVDSHIYVQQGSDVDKLGNETSKISPDENVGAYKDYSHVEAPSKVAGAITPSSLASVGKEPTFPAKLHMILSNPEYADIISWLPHGRSWRILQQKTLEEQILPLYFRHGRYSSFSRQVNGWGFRRVIDGPDYNSYYHELFLRCMPHLCDKMRRLTSKDTIVQRKVCSPSPNFYAISQKNPLPQQAESSIARDRPLSPQYRESMASMEGFLTDHQRALNLVQLFSHSGSGQRSFVWEQNSQSKVTLQNGFGSHQSIQDVQSTRMYGSLMPTPLAAVNDCIRQLQLLKAGPSVPSMSNLLPLNPAFLGGSNLNF